MVDRRGSTFRCGDLSRVSLFNSFTCIFACNDSISGKIVLFLFGSQNCGIVCDQQSSTSLSSDGQSIKDLVIESQFSSLFLLSLRIVVVFGNFLDFV